MMKTKRNLPAKPDWYFVDARVEDFWTTVDFEPPLNLLDIFRAGGCTVKTYQELSQKSNISVQRVGLCLGSEDGFVCYDASHDRYRLAYDCERRGARMRWTLAHELGHAVCTPDANTSWISAYTLALNTDRIEREANTFAVELLLPDSFIRENEGCSIYQLARLRGVPEKLAELKMEV